MFGFQPSAILAWKFGKGPVFDHRHPEQLTKGGAVSAGSRLHPTDALNRPNKGKTNRNDSIPVWFCLSRGCGSFCRSCSLGPSSWTVGAECPGMASSAPRALSPRPRHGGADEGQAPVCGSGVDAADESGFENNTPLPNRIDQACGATPGRDQASANGSSGPIS